MKYEKEKLKRKESLKEGERR